MEWNNFKDLFHESWHNKIRPFVESEECDRIYAYLKKESGRGRKITPLSSNVFRCFLETPFDELKVIMMGMCPYHTMRNGQCIADGLLMGCSETNYLQPSLDLFYKGVETELYDGLNLNYNQNPDVSYLAHQGVLMTNAALTVEVGKPGSHLNLWEPFTKYFFEEVVNTTGVPVIFLGRDAAKMERYVAPFTWVFKVNHPASAAYNHTEWDTEGTFKQVNKVLMDTNGYTIQWLDTNESDDLPF